VATSDAAAGAALRIKYADATRGELLMDYGFLPEPVPAEACLTWSLDEDDLNYDEKCDVVEVEGLAAEQPFSLAEQASVPEELLAFLRLKHLRGADAFLCEAIFRNALWAEHLPLPVSEENERAALTDGRDRCAAALASLRGSLQEDLATLAEAPRASRGYRLAAVRYAERRALEAASRQFDSQLGALNSLEYYQERRLRSLNLNPIETQEEVDRLAADSMPDRAAGRSFGAQDYEW